MLLFAHLSVSLFSKQIIHGDNRLYHAAVLSGTQSVRGDERWEDALFCSGLCHEIPNTRSNLQAFRRKNKWAKFAFFLHFSPTYECFFLLCVVSNSGISNHSSTFFRWVMNRPRSPRTERATGAAYQAVPSSIAFLSSSDILPRFTRRQ